MFELFLHWPGINLQKFELIRLSSAAVSKDSSLICGGFEDSSIRLWSLTPKKLVRQKNNPDISTIQLTPGKGGISSVQINMQHTIKIIK